MQSSFRETIAVIDQLFSCSSAGGSERLMRYLSPAGYLHCLEADKENPNGRLNSTSNAGRMDTGNIIECCLVYFEFTSSVKPTPPSPKKTQIKPTKAKPNKTPKTKTNKQISFLSCSHLSSFKIRAQVY